MYGVVSAGVDCLNPDANGYPGIYTNVEYYMDWILDNMTQWGNFDTFCIVF